MNSVHTISQGGWSFLPKFKVPMQGCPVDGKDVHVVERKAFDSFLFIWEVPASVNCSYSLFYASALLFQNYYLFISFKINSYRI